MIAMYLRSGSEEELDALRTAMRKQGVGRDEPEVHLTAVGRGATLWDADQGPLSWFESMPTGLFNAVGLSPEIRLFDHPWGHAFVRRVIEHARHTVVMPTIDRRAARKRGHLNPDDILRLVDTPRWNAVGAGSTLHWYFEEAGKLALDYAAYRARPSEARLFEQCADFLIQHPDVDDAAPAEQDLDVRGSIAWLVDWANYAVAGIGYKSALLTYIIDQHLGKRKSIAMLDIGGGAGLLATEVGGGDPKRFDHVVTCEPVAINLIPARRLQGYHPSASQMAIATGQTFNYDRAYDVISMIGSLLYVPREETQMTLDRAWDALAPGGVLVVHENIRKPSFTKDFDVMFTVDELEGYLGRYGRPTYYLSTGAVAVKPQDVGERTVFRVMQKT